MIQDGIAPLKGKMMGKLTADQEAAIKIINTIFVESPTIKNILSSIDEIRDDAVQSGFSNLPDCILVTGESGAGKTSLIEKYLNKSPIGEGDEHTSIPILHADLPNSKHPKPIAERLLLALEGMAADVRVGDHSKLTGQLIHQMNKARVELVILDEFQHFIESQSERVIEQNGDWLKSFINASKRPVILFGMPWSKVVLSSNSQLSNRFGLRFDLHPFTRDSYNDFRVFLKRVDKELPFTGDFQLFTADTAFRLFAASSGNIGLLMRHIIRPAARTAVKQGLGGLSNEILYRACDSRMEVLHLTSNPFHGDIENIVALECTAPSRWQQNQVRGKSSVIGAKYRKTSIADIFRSK